MSTQQFAQAYLEWTKQKLDESAATLAKLDEAVAKLSDAANDQTKAALAQLKTTRDTFKAKADSLRADLDSSKQVSDSVLGAIAGQWTEVELAFAQFLKASENQADVVKSALSARAEAQFAAFQSSMEQVRSSAAATLEKGRAEFDAALRKVAEHAETTLNPKLTELSTASEESLKALKSGFDETIAIYDKTWGKITEAFTKPKKPSE
jgi:hypothetical protein